jgi:predicted O-linked N-acetylglucosamine transferase (SPINDLY family)
MELPSGFQVTSFDREPAIGDPPSAASGRVTFGSFNNPAKISDRILELWSATLRRLPEARLVIKGKFLECPEVRDGLSRRLEAHGIAAGRVGLFGLAAAADHLDWHNRIDIALDTLPFCGGRTTIDALWMGVPVITRIGETAVGRFSYSHLARIGAPELAADSDDTFVDIATALADDLPRLRHYRRTLREAMRASSLFDETLHVAELEQAYRIMWRRWCAESLDDAR